MRSGGAEGRESELSAGIASYDACYTLGLSSRFPLWICFFSPCPCTLEVLADHEGSSATAKVGRTGVRGPRNLPGNTLSFWYLRLMGLKEKMCESLKLC